MKVVEILKLGQKWLELLHEACIKVEDVRFIELYDDYLSMLECKNKISYIVAVLSEKYRISERKVYYLLKRLSSDCNFSAEP